MLILVYGEDTFRVQEKVKELQTAFSKKFDPTGLNLSVFDSDTKRGEVLQAIGSLPFMSPKRMVVIRDVIANAKKSDEDDWVTLTRTPESTIVVLWETSAVEKKPLFATVKKGADVHAYPFPLLESSVLTKWTADRIKSRGGIITKDALTELCTRVGGDLWQMDNEIAKLIAFASNRTIEKKDIDDLVRATFEGEIFALIDAVSQKNGEQAIKLLMQERESGASDFQIFSMLARQVRILIGARAMLDENPQASSDQLATDMNLHPFVAQKAIVHAKRYTLNSLRSTHDLLFRYDAGMKSGQIDAELAVDLVTTKILEVS